MEETAERANGSDSTGVQDRHLREEDVRKYLLQFILQCKGVVSENTLLSCYLTLEYDAGRLAKDEPIRLDALKRKLSDQVSKINMELSSLHYKISTVHHPLGKSYASKRFSSLVTDIADANWPENGRFYVYCNTKYDAHMQIATSFSPAEIEYVKWSINMMLTSNSSAQVYEPERISNDVVEEVDRVLREKYNNGEYSGLNTCISNQIRSGALLQSEHLTMSRRQEILDEMTQKRWFYASSDGKIGLDLRFAVEMKDYLIESYDIPVCVTCKEVVLQGIICLNCREENNYGWHVGCLEHYVKHVDDKCPGCGTRFKDGAAYILG